MQRLLIHGQGTTEHVEHIKNFIETRLPYEVVTSDIRKSSEDLLGQKAFHLMIFETNRLKENDLEWIADLRHRGFVYPILFISETTEVRNMAHQLEKLKAHLLEKPFEFKALRGLVQKLMLARHVPQQMHRRFKTQQNAVLETYLSGEVLTSQMFNLSVGGAYIEFNGKPRLGVGELVRLKVHLDDLSREHCVNARIVWTSRKGLNGGGSGIGVRFIKGDDIYRQLMDKV